MIPPAAAPPNAPIPAPFSRVVNEPPAQPATRVLAKLTIPIMLTKPDFEFDINFMDAASFTQLDARAQVLFTPKLVKGEKQSAGLSEC
jgi:hypothetical protein